jgi:hypothetical protein
VKECFGLQRPLMSGAARVLLFLLINYSDESTWQQYAKSIVTKGDFQIALIICAAELVAYVIPDQPRFPGLTAQLGRISKLLDMWEAIRCYRCRKNLNHSLCAVTSYHHHNLFSMTAHMSQR